MNDLTLVPVGNDTLIRLSALTDLSTGNPITTASVSAQFKDSQDQNVGSSITLSHKATGTYEGVAPDTLAITEGEHYTVVITADDGADRHAEWKLAVLASRRP